MIKFSLLTDNTEAADSLCHTKNSITNSRVNVPPDRSALSSLASFSSKTPTMGITDVKERVELV
jgi:hypothetical protein